MSAGIPLVRRSLAHLPLRTAAAVSAIAAGAMLMFFLDGVKAGVIEGAGSYAGQPGVDLWLARRGTANLIRSSSVLPDTLVDLVASDPAVERAAPLLRAFVTVESAHKRLTLLGMGYDTRSGVGAPPRLVAGHHVEGPRELVLDRAAAHRLRVGVGDSVRLNGVHRRVAGLSDGTNLLGTQLVFAGLDDLVLLTGANGQISFVAARLRDAADTATFAARWGRRDPDVAVFTRAAFAQNSLDEVYTGFQPIVRSLALQGAIVAAAVIALILYGRVLERRTELAMLLTLGGTPAFLHRLVLAQAVAMALLGVAAGAGCTVALGALIERYAPEMAFAYAPTAMARSGVVVLFAAVVGAVLPIVSIGRIEPAEVFRA